MILQQYVYQAANIQTFCSNCEEILTKKSVQNPKFRSCDTKLADSSSSLLIDRVHRGRFYEYSIATKLGNLLKYNESI